MKHFDASSFEAEPAAPRDWQVRLSRLEAAVAQAQQAAAQANERALKVKELCFETTTDCVFELDRQWRLTYLNTRAQEEVARGRNLIGEHVLNARFRIFPAVFSGSASAES